MLETKDLTIRFGGHVAVDHVSCAFQPGTLTAIVGPNGAGKTTYFNLISGQLRASAGTVHARRRRHHGEPRSARTHRGLGRAFQLTQLFPQPDGAGERAPGGAVARGAKGLNLWSVWLDHRDTLERAACAGRAGARWATAPTPRPAACRTATSASSRWRC